MLESAALGLIQALRFLIFYTAVCAGVSLIAWIWMAWREKRIRAERDACAGVLSMLQVDDLA